MRAAKAARSNDTVANYQTIIRQKLGTDTPAKFMRIAVQHGLLDDIA